MPAIDSLHPDNSYRVHLFGTTRFQCGGGRIEAKLSSSAHLLLAMLTTRPDDTHNREALAFTLWPDYSEEAALANLRRHLYQLQRALPSAVASPIACDKRYLRWIAGDRTWVDVNEFESASARPDGIETAIYLYKGDFMPFADHEWACGRRDQLRTVVRRNLETAIRRRREAGDTVGALRYVEDLLALDPWREDVLRDLMDLRWRIGDRAGALATFRDFSRRLRTELAADPMPETVHVVQTIAQQAFQVA